MNRLPLLVLCLLASAALPACKIVKTAPAKTEGAAAQADPIQSLVAETYDAQLLPLIADKAQPVADLRRAVAADLNAAGAAHGNRGAGEGAAWNFAVRGEGRVISANLESRARVAALDTDGDGTPDLTLQLGPVIKGTALRDLAPFYRFGDFRDQIEFAQLARALNDRLSSTLTIPDGDLTGQTIAFTGALPLKAAGDPWLVTAVTVTATP
jgi:predicted lipoprotein